MTNERRPGLALPRRLNLGDLAISVGAIGVFLAQARRSWLDPPHGLRTLIFDQGRNYSTDSSIFPTLPVEIAGQGLIVASLALILIRLRQPRPRWRRLVRQPGWIGASAGLLGSAICLGVDQLQDRVEKTSLLIREPWMGSFTFRHSLFPDQAALAGGLAVLVAWLVLCGTGICRPERSAIDRLGRLIGLGWIILPLVRLGRGVVRVVWP